MAELWDDFARQVLPKNCSFTQRQEMRRAFYAGAQGILYKILGLFTEGNEPSETDLKIMDNLEKELNKFGEDVKAGRS